MKNTEFKKAPKTPTREELLNEGVFTKNLYDNPSFPMYRYYDSYYVLSPMGKPSKVISK